MLTRLGTARSRREFVSRMCLAAMAAPVMAAALPGEATPTQGPSKPLPFNAEGPFDVRVRPVAGHVEHLRQLVQWQTFDHFGRVKWTREAIGYARKEEFRKEGQQEPWHRVTWKFLTEEDHDGYGQRLAARVLPYSKNFSYESPVTGGIWDAEMDLRAMPRTTEGFVFLHHSWDLQWTFYQLSDKVVDFDKLKRIGDSVSAGVDPKALGDNWFTRPTWEFDFEPAVQYWLGESSLTLSLGGLTKVGKHWCALLLFDGTVPERHAYRNSGGDSSLTYHVRTLLTGHYAISLETNHVARCAWDHFAILGTEETPPKPRLMEAMPGLTLLWRQVLWMPVSEKEFAEAVPQVEG